MHWETKKFVSIWNRACSISEVCLYSAYITARISGICGSFNDAVSTSDSTSSNGKMDELKRMWQEAVVA
jgi:hypothetical protein